MSKESKNPTTPIIDSFKLDNTFYFCRHKVQRGKLSKNPYWQSQSPDDGNRQRWVGKDLPAEVVAKRQDIEAIKPQAEAMKFQLEQALNTLNRFLYDGTHALIPDVEAILAEYDTQISEANESQAVSDLREYYRQNFRNGASDEAFVLWIQSELDE